MKNLILFVGLFFTYQSQAQTFNGVGSIIPDGGPAVDFYINVAGLSQPLGASLGLKKICIDITHSYDSDLKASLISPSGQQMLLFNGIGGGDDNFTNTCFDHLATNPISAGTAPFTGIFKPLGMIGSMNNGQPGNGQWILRVEDMAAADTGYLNTWSIEFGANASLPYVPITDIPMLVINTNGNGITWNKSVASMKIINNGIGNLNYVTDSGNAYTGNVGIKYRGSFSASLPQKPMSFTTYGTSTSADFNTSLLGMPTEHDWILLATYNDKSFVRNPMMYEIWRDMGHYAARSRYVEVVLDGEYQGVYSLMEKIKRDSNRVSIPKLAIADISGDELTGGYIIKHDYQDVGWQSQFVAQPCNETYDFNFVYPKPDSMPVQQKNYIQHYVDTIEARLYGTQVNHPTKGYRPYIHINSFVDYMLANEMGWNGDGYKKSMYFFKEKNSKDSTLHAGPIWDFDWALKRMPWTPTDHSGWYYATPPCDGDVLFLPWWNIMMQDTFFANEAKCRWKFHRKFSMHIDSINKYIDKQALYLQNAQQRHYNYWQTLGINVGTPEAAPFSVTFQQEIDTLKSTIKQRILWIDAHLQGTCWNEIEPQSLQDVALSEIMIYPNPTTEMLYINNCLIVNQIKIVDLTGRVVMHQRMNGQQQIQLNVSSLAIGIYTIQLDTKEGIAVRKFLKE